LYKQKKKTRKKKTGEMGSH